MTHECLLVYELAPSRARQVLALAEPSTVSAQAEPQQSITNEDVIMVGSLRLDSIAKQCDHIVKAYP